jgi:hypothetical protein
MPMKTQSVALPVTLALITGCATAFAEHSTDAPYAASRAGGAPSVGACLVTGPSRTIAPNARLLPAIDVASATNKLVVRVATKRDEAVEMSLDPASGEATPVTTGADTCASSLKNAKTVAGDHPFAIGIADGKLAWSSCGGAGVQALWDLPGPGLKDLQVVTLGEQAGFAIAFRKENAVWLGRLDSDKKPLGSLTKVAERAQLRWPTLAESGGSVMLAWAEQDAGSETWSLSAASFAKSGTATAVRIALPSGGIGGDAMQPSLAGLDGGRFLLAWTEGTAWAHQIRAVTLDANGAPGGQAVRVSDSDGVGWARLAVTPDGHGAVLFMTSKDDGFAAVATPIACPAPTPDEPGALTVARH